MSKENFIEFDQIMENLKNNNPKMYCEIKEEAKNEVEKIKKRGGKRLGSGRKAIYKDRISINKRVSNESRSIIKEVASLKKISENDATDLLIKEGYKIIGKLA